MCPINSGKLYKKSASQKFLESPSKEGSGPTRAPRGCLAPPWATPPALLAALWPPSVPPLAYIYPPQRKPLISICYSRTSLCTAAVSRSGLREEAAPAPCRKEEL